MPKIALTFTTELDDFNNKVKNCIIRVRLLSFSNEIESITDHITGEKLFFIKLIVDFTDNNQNQIVNDKFVYFLKNDLNSLKIGEEYWGRITRSAHRDGTARSPIAEMLNVSTKNVDIKKIDYKRDFSLHYTSNSKNLNYLSFFKFQKTINSKFYSNLLSYPFSNPPYSKKNWFDDTLKEFQFDTLLLKKDQILKCNSPGYEITEKMIENNEVENYYKKESIDFFLSKLSICFDEMVFTGVGKLISNKGYKNLYILPDVLLYDKNTNIHIAIDIDIPYEIKSRKVRNAINLNVLKELEDEEFRYENDHKKLYENDDIDLVFSESFYNSGELYDLIDHMQYDLIDHRVYGPFSIYSSWLYFKFSENQVVLNSNSCCKYINDKTLELTGINLSNYNFEDVSDLKNEQMWTTETASNMSNQKFRENLLGLISDIEFSKKNYSQYKKDYDEWARKIFYKK